MAIIKKKNYESSEQAKNRIYKERTEDMIINDMINDHKIVINPIAARHSIYTEANPMEKDAYSLLAFDIISKRYDEDLKNYPRGASAFDIVSYIKSFNDSDDYDTLLTSEFGAPKDSPAGVYDDIFGADVGLMKQAALAGLMIKLENSEDINQV